jgi:acetolactate synthase-1/2/3 large subunit
MLNDGDILVSDIIRNFFEEKGLRHVFLLSGGMMMNLLDSISKSTKIRYICNHHEQASAMAAEVYARVNNSLGLCYKWTRSHKYNYWYCRSLVRF